MKASSSNEPCRHISRPAVTEKRLSLTLNGKIHYQLKTPYHVTTPALPSAVGALNAAPAAPATPFHRLINQLLGTCSQQLSHRISTAFDLETQQRYSYPQWRITSGCLIVSQQQIIQIRRLSSTAQTPDSVITRPLSHRLWRCEKRRLCSYRS